MPDQGSAKTAGASSKAEHEYGELYAEHRLRIYEIYERSVHGISDRRQLANSFYLTICTAILGYLAQFGQNPLLVVAGIAICVLWLRGIKSYRDINAAKFKVIHEVESYLPLRPYTEEWDALEKGKNPNVYRPFASIEGVIPWIFGLLIAGAFVSDPKTLTVVTNLARSVRIIP